MVKNQTKISPSSVISHHHFFKVYFPNLSSHHLKIPASFIDKFDRALPEKAIIKDHFGRFWHVEVAKVDNELFFQNGWQGFVEHHCLKTGDFLVFKYNGNSVFDVKVFDNSECEREDSMDYIYANKNPSFVKKEIESGDLETFSQPVCDTEQIGSEKCWKKMDKTKISDEIKFDKEKVLDAACFIDPKNPHFTVSIKHHRPYDLHIPKQVVIDHDLKIKPEMILRDRSGKSWPVKVYFRKDGRIIISRGWFAFWTENNLEHGDKCVLEFNKEKGGTSNIINVYMLPKLQQTAGKCAGKKQGDDGNIWGLLFANATSK
ncbi:B3 DNA binding domain [Macleaya cordata]|uniref:B3 DNA binding domain n=1 Tax=Macleaya cordata TaxID=56857 RepID=A0A200Q3Z7_MACCD|nr:B3 DNA binding domain [Macleaya cordata]